MRLADIPLILPAAGRSIRMGSPKGLIIVDGRTWLEIQCESFRKAGGLTVLLVLGYDRAAYLEALRVEDGAPPQSILLGGCQVHFLDNLLPEFGPFSSLQTACHWVVQHPKCSAAFFQPIDTPVPSPKVLTLLAQSLATNMQVGEPRYHGVGGHPVLLSRDFALRLLTLNADGPQSRLDHQILEARVTGSVASVAVDDARVSMNLNDAAAWEQYIAEYSTDADPVVRRDSLTPEFSLS